MTAARTDHDTHDRPPPGWTRLGEWDGTPVWRHDIATLWIATDDLDLLRCLSATLLTVRHRCAAADLAARLAARHDAPESTHP